MVVDIIFDSNRGYSLISKFKQAVEELPKELQQKFTKTVPPLFLRELINTTKATEIPEILAAVSGVYSKNKTPGKINIGNAPIPGMTIGETVAKEMHVVHKASSVWQIRCRTSPVAILWRRLHDGYVVGLSKGMIDTLKKHGIDPKSRPRSIYYRPTNLFRKMLRTKSTIIRAELEKQVILTINRLVRR